ncbi:MAG: hypothetical protein R3B70_06350 [Polyangiaceae bacterium]
MKTRPKPATLPGLCGAILTAAVALAPSEATATEPCVPDAPCHNNFAEPIVMFVLGSDAFGFGLIGTIGNAVTLGRGTRPGTGWLTMGYFGAAYNLALGATWTSLAAPALAKFPTDGYARTQLAMGITHLSLSAITLGVTAAAHSRRIGWKDTPDLALIPSFVPEPGGGTLMLTGQF